MSLSQAQTWLKSISTEAFQRFTTVIGRELMALCKYCAVNPPTQYNEAASLHYSRPTFSHRFQTGKTKTKRSSSGVWYIYFGLEDTDKDGRPDTLSVVTISHAARPPLWEEPHGEDENNAT
ncbi:MAG: hypothetical protein NTX57_02415 [Armatimonadetes bacterium]|nr:hypothetical protein [Armatimonadota bacterium]